MTGKLTYVIAEAGVNHNGSIEMALQLVDEAVRAGADAVKFQTFKAANLVSKKALKADYQLKTTDQGESQYEMIRKLELNAGDHRRLIDHCQKKGIQFLSTPFDLESADLLIEEFDIPKLKVSSGDLTNAPLLLRLAQSQKPIILSTGMSTLEEVREALGVIAFGYLKPKSAKPSKSECQAVLQSEAAQTILKSKVTLLHCTTEYPAPFVDVNLRAMDTMRENFGLKTGFSDHTAGIAIPIAAVARGAEVIEKHFTLDRNLPGPDHKASLEPAELTAMIKAIREVEVSLGSSVKAPSPSEMKNIAIARRSLVAACEIKKGEAYTIENLAVKRPGNGIAPILFWECLGKVAPRDFKPDELIEL